MPLRLVLYLASRALEPLWTRAREIAVRDELGAVGHCIEEAQSYLTQIRVLHQGALASTSSQRF